MAFSLLRMGVRASVAVEKGAARFINLENGCKQVLARQQCVHRGLYRASVQGFSKQAGNPKRGYVSESDSDSDSDDEHAERGTSEFWRRKIRSFHGVIDVNKDGVVSYDDFKMLADRFIQLGHLTTEQKTDFVEALRHVWEEQWGIVDKYNMVTQEQYLENMHHVLNDKSLKRKAHKFLPYLFQDATHSFEAIDINRDGFISMKEFVKHGRDYFLTENEAKPSKMFWGPLIKP